MEKGKCFVAKSVWWEREVCLMGRGKYVKLGREKCVLWGSGKGKSVW